MAEAFTPDEVINLIADTLSEASDEFIAQAAERVLGHRTEVLGESIVIHFPED